MIKFKSGLSIFFLSTMTVNSPLSLFSLVKELMIEDIDPRLFSSKFLVNSLQIAILWELPKTLPNSFKVLIISQKYSLSRREVYNLGLEILKS